MNTVNKRPEIPGFTISAADPQAIACLRNYARLLPDGRRKDQVLAAIDAFAEYQTEQNKRKE